MRTALSSFSTDDFPGSYSKMLLGSARYFLVSTFLSGGSQSFLWKKAVLSEGMDKKNKGEWRDGCAAEWKRANPY